MKKIVLTLAVAALAIPTIAAAQTAAAPAAAAPVTATATTTTTTTTMTAPAADKKVELNNGAWANIAADGTVTVSSDGGKTWAPAPDGTWTSKDGATTIMTKGGKKI